jgi:hypothetical protein
MQKDLGPLLIPFNPALGIAVQEFGRGKPLMSVVSGLHGDEYNSLYVCHLFIDWLRGAAAQHNGYTLRGRVRVLPAVNPPGLLLGDRHWPFDNTDLDRVFPGYNQGETTQRLASWIFEAVRQSICCVDLHAGSHLLEEWPQVLAWSGQPRAIDLAKSMGLPLVWLRQLASQTEMRPQALEVTGSVQSTLAYNLFQLGVDTLVVRAGGGQRLDPARCQQVFLGLVRLALHLGVASGPAPAPGEATPQVVTAAQIQPLHARAPGIFVAEVGLGQRLEAGQCLGQVLDPLKGELREEVRSPLSGRLVALRCHPVVLEGSLIARVARTAT